MSSVPLQKLRRYVLTGAVAATTATGAWYGAGLKTREESKQERKVALQATPEERIEQLENMKTKLLNHRAELQGKIDRLTTETTSDAVGTPDGSR